MKKSRNQTKHNKDPDEIFLTPQHISQYERKEFLKERISFFVSEKVSWIISIILYLGGILSLFILVPVGLHDR